jgi:hypothetical protein
MICCADANAAASGTGCRATTTSLAGAGGRGAVFGTEAGGGLRAGVVFGDLAGGPEEGGVSSNKPARARPAQNSAVTMTVGTPMNCLRHEANIDFSTLDEYRHNHAMSHLTCP